jgi:hypothetical protein
MSIKNNWGSRTKISRRNKPEKREKRTAKRPWGAGKAKRKIAKARSFGHSPEHDNSDSKNYRQLVDQQADMLQRLKSNAWFRRLGKALACCTAERCGRMSCVEVCVIADGRSRQRLVSAAQRLLLKADCPFYEVRLVRGIWARPVGELVNVSIAAAKQLNRRALDSLFIPALVAVGRFKVSLNLTHHDPYWLCEIHQIVAGASKEVLERAFVGTWGREKYDSVVRIAEATDLRRTIEKVLNADLRTWKHPDLDDGISASPTKARREEFYRWLFSLPFGERIIRYGCDRYLNRLKKKPRTMRAKIYKPRPYPAWLTPHMFGNRPQPLRGNFGRSGRYGRDR